MVHIYIPKLSTVFLETSEKLFGKFSVIWSTCHNDLRDVHVAKAQFYGYKYVSTRNVRSSSGKVPAEKTLPENISDKVLTNFGNFSVVPVTSTVKTLPIKSTFSRL